MEWNDLQSVLALARARTFSAAAAELRTSHTTIGRRVRALEEELGVRLFDRTPEGYVPTAAGQDVAEVAERVETEVLSLEGRVMGRDAQLHGPLRVTTMDLLFRRYQRELASFMARYPAIALTVGTTDTEASLTRREADVALRLTRTPPEHLVGRKIGRIDFAVYGSKALVDRIGARASYAAYPWLHWDERLGMHWLDEWLAKHAKGARVAMRVGGATGAVREAVLAGIGVHFLACSDGDADARLVRIGEIEPEFSRDVWLLTLPELRANHRVRAFLDHFAEATAKPPEPAAKKRRSR